MVRIELVPNLSSCIETVAKKEFRRLVADYFRAGETDTEFEEKFELLRTFLNSTDFRELRRDSEKYLRQGKSVKFILFWKEGKADYELEVEH